LKVKIIKYINKDNINAYNKFYKDKDTFLKFYTITSEE